MERIDKAREVNKHALLLAKGQEPYELIIGYLTGDTLSHLETSKQAKLLARIPDFFMLRGRLRKRFTGGQSKQYVPPDEIAEVLRQCHGSSTIGHLGIAGMFRLVNLKYFWPGQYADVKRLVETCDVCQRFQQCESSQYRLHHIPPPPTIFNTLGLDTIGPLPLSNGKQYVLNLICYLSGWVESVTIRNLDGRNVAKAIQHSWFDRYGYPQTIITDNGSSLSTGHFCEICDEKKVNIITASAYHPHTNGKVENYNKFMVHQLAHCLAENRAPVDRWADHLDRVTWTWRVHHAPIAGASPFKAVFGQAPRLPIHNQYDPVWLNEEDMSEIEEDRRAYVRALRGETHSRIIRHHELLTLNSDVPPPRAFKVGQAVLLYNSVRSKTKAGKLEPCWRGPYWVQACLSGGAYRLNEIRDGRLQLHRQGRSVNHLWLTKYREENDMEMSGNKEE